MNSENLSMGAVIVALTLFGLTATEAQDSELDESAKSSEGQNTDAELIQGDDHYVYALNKASNIVGSEVHDQDGNHVATVQDLVIDLNSEAVAYAVLEINAGLLDFSEQLKAIPIRALIPENTDEESVFTIDGNTLKSIEIFDGSNWPLIRDSDLIRRFDRQFPKTEKTETQSEQE